eukprot:gnl/TRDRNA2_/TRDRNA2_166850_c1_seq3.p1 gnl/TRDRNA2_/TRDRNA2_166850_c1~~gnl/TRDRNA2_/TRDRNA2_166850_c1_seq3.p1  ORF type:complete len:580 (+),score=85.75 gnl/TRDRNA2_/TRDRNA2_166850_c1_seq3:145-1740(+)
MLGSEAAPYVDALGQCMEDDDVEVRVSAAQALGQVGEGASQQTWSLVRCIDDPDPRVRRNVAWALGRIGHASDIHSMALVRRMKDPVLAVKHTAEQALVSMKEAGSERARRALERRRELAQNHSRTQLLSDLTDKDPDVRLDAAWTVAMACPSLTDATGCQYVPVLCERLQDEDVRVRRCMARVVSMLGKADAKQTQMIAAALSRCLHDSDAEVRKTSSLALAYLGAAASPYADQLVSMLDDRDLEVSRNACFSVALASTLKQSNQDLVAKDDMDDDQADSESEDDTGSEKDEEWSPLAPPRLALRTHSGGQSWNRKKSMRHRGTKQPARRDLRFLQGAGLGVTIAATSEDDKAKFAFYREKKDSQTMDPFTTGRDPTLALKKKKFCLSQVKPAAPVLRPSQSTPVLPPVGPEARGEDLAGCDSAQGRLRHASSQPSLSASPPCSSEGASGFIENRMRCTLGSLGTAGPRRSNHSFSGGIGQRDVRARGSGSKWQPFDFCETPEGTSGSVALPAVTKQSLGTRTSSFRSMR